MIESTKLSNENYQILVLMFGGKAGALSPPVGPRNFRALNEADTIESIPHEKAVLDKLAIL